MIGAEVMLEGLGAGRRRLPRALLLLVQNKQGYLNLSELLARAWTQQRGARPRRWSSWPGCKELNEGLIALSGAQAGPVGQALVQGDDARAHEAALQLASMFPHRFYLELQRAGRADDEAHVAAAVQLAARLKLPVVATHPVQFTEPDDYEAHEARVCIAEGEILGNPRRVRRSRASSISRPRRRWRRCSPTCRRAMANTLEIAKRCNLTLVLGKPQLPDFPTPGQWPAHVAGGLLPPRLARGAGGAPGAPVPGRGRARAADARATWSGWSSRSTPS